MENTKGIHYTCKETIESIEKIGITINDLAKSGHQLVGANEDDEVVIIGAYDDGENGIVIKTSTIQSNGLLRVNKFYPDGSSEGYFEK